MPCYIYHLLSPHIKYIRLRHRTKFQNLTLADFRHCKMHIKPHAHLRHITCQAGTHASQSPSTTEQYLNKNWTPVRERVHAGFDINWLNFSGGEGCLRIVATYAVRCCTCVCKICIKLIIGYVSFSTVPVAAWGLAWVLV